MDTKAELRITCPKCTGFGRFVMLHARGERPLTEEEVSELSKCQFCGGSGKVSSEQWDRHRIGLLLRNARREAGMGLRAFAEFIGIEPSTWARIENGNSGGGEEGQ